jgi:prepilin-type N-terminal cleavage/methylation domain-containing protein
MKTKHVFKRGKGSEGFTLIELSIVLIIIGLLLGAIVKGKDLIKSAELKKFYNSFIQQWELVYNNYYDRTGKVLGGALVVKEGDTNSSYDEFVGADILSTDSDLVLRDLEKFKKDTGYIATTLDATGLTPPGAVQGYYNRYELTASKLGRTKVIITFGSDPSGKKEITVYQNATDVNSTGAAVDENGDEASTTNNIGGQGTSKGNFMLLINLPYDIAPQIDKLIDGTTDAKSGKLICVQSYDSEVTSINQLSDVITSSYNDLGADAPDCGGPLGWGNSTQPYASALYKLEF